MKNLLTAWEMQIFIAVCKPWASFCMYMYVDGYSMALLNMYNIRTLRSHLFSSWVLFSSLDLNLSILIPPCFPFSFRTFLFTLSWFSSSFSCLRFSHSFFSCPRFSFTYLSCPRLFFIFISSPVSFLFLLSAVSPIFFLSIIFKGSV